MGGDILSPIYHTVRDCRRHVVLRSAKESRRCRGVMGDEKEIGPGRHGKKSMLELTRAFLSTGRRRKDYHPVQAEVG